MYGVDTATADQRAAFLDRVARRALRMNQARLRRLAEEIGEAGLDIDLSSEWGQIVITEVDYALRPARPRAARAERRHDHRADDRADGWEAGTQLLVTRRPIEAMPLNGSRLFADGLASWLIRRVDGRRRVGGVRPAGRLRARPRGARRDDGRDDRAAPPERLGAHRRRRVRRAALGRPDVAPRTADRRRGSTPSRRAATTATGTCWRSCSSSPSTTSAPAASARSCCTAPTAARRRRSSCACRRRRRSTCAGRATSPRCATPWPRSTAPP